MTGLDEDACRAATTGELLRNIKFIIEYDGANYLGWQRQPQGMTIQQALEDAIQQVTGVISGLTGSGRTDTGVHALGQAANFKTDSQLPAQRLMKAVNSLLPRDIAVVSAVDVPLEFNARFAAKSKLYRYTIWNGPVRPVMQRAGCWHLRWRLDVMLMQQAADGLLGSHEFDAFQSSGASVESTRRVVSRADWSQRGHLFTFDIEANGFLYNMVRAIVGTLTDVGREKITVPDFQKILARKDRTLAGRTAPAQGLCLMDVRY